MKRAKLLSLLTVALIACFGGLTFAQNLSDFDTALPSEEEETQEMINARLDLLYDGETTDPSGLIQMVKVRVKNPADAITPVDRKTKGILTLTFDDGPDRTLTPIVLATLAKHKIHATFFMLGANVQKNLDLVKKVLAAGHLIGVHSFNHPNFARLSTEMMHRQVSFTSALLKPYMTAGPFFRFPYGRATADAIKYVESLHYDAPVGWHVDTCDYAADKGYLNANEARACEWKAGKLDFVPYMVKQIDRVGGGIVLMHDVHRSTAIHLDEIITALENKGYRFTNLNDTAVYPNQNKAF